MSFGRLVELEYTPGLGSGAPAHPSSSLGPPTKFLIGFRQVAELVDARGFPPRGKPKL